MQTIIKVVKPLESLKQNRMTGWKQSISQWKEKYMEFDLNNHGDIDIMGLKRMLEKLGAAKTHLELKKMIKEVAGDMGETISYSDFVKMMLGKRSVIAKIILLYEEKAKEPVKLTGFPMKKTFSDLP
ncbi:hypothetical protein scyTo_0001114 [Scyliorhinus torazame]|uniref:Allograft inflammatory factor 1-like EF-hand domain-containing protein n=1 Tax=Scyliorhinus torazame TaxID=75743 RepID=A0A401P972_SCYTO|nr:hypothetical protein [Scyliorhinus torazame]